MDLSSKNMERLNKRINMSNLYEKPMIIELKSDLLSLMYQKSDKFLKIIKISSKLFLWLNVKILYLINFLTKPIY